MSAAQLFRGAAMFLLRLGLAFAQFIRRSDISRGCHGFQRSGMATVCIR
jgi:hypothetical protein